MNIEELQTFNLADAAKFHFRLNPKLWGKNEKLLPDVKKNLLEIAEDFREFLGIPELEIKDITISGSNAAYSYTDKSDIDLHLVVEFPEGKDNDVYRELFNAKKFQYNTLHDYKIGDSDVELYVQNVKDKHTSQGIYSLLGDVWIQTPRRVKATIDDLGVKDKYEEMGHRVEQAIASGDVDLQKGTIQRLKDMRQTGLDTHGEFGPENLAFKMLRNQGLIQELFDAYYRAKSERHSLEEIEKQTKKKFTYGYRQIDEVGSTPDGTNPSTCMDLNEVGSTPDGTNPSTCMELNESTPEDLLKEFVKYCSDRLELKHEPKLKLRRDPQWPKVHKTFGRYTNDTRSLEVAWGSRHLMDVFRTVAHELVHQRQHEMSNLPDHAGETGSEWENDANASAGILMRDWAQKHPDMFMYGTDDELDEGIKDWGKKAAMGAMAAGALAGGLPQNAHAHNGSFGYYMGREIGRQLSQGPMAPVANAGRIANNIRNITPQQVRGEAQQELYNFIRANGGDPHGMNQSQLYQWQRRMDTNQDARDADSQPASMDYVGDYKTDNPMPARARPRRGEGSIDPQWMQESASGYIPTKKQAKDPRWSMALTQDIKPGQLGKEANKLNLKTNKQGQPQIANPNGLVEALTKQLAMFKQGTLTESEELDEVKMSPSSLQKFASSDAAKGIQAGFEAELIFTGLGEAEEGEYEPDYDADERAYSIQQVVDFFENDEYGYGLSQRGAERLREQLDETYYEWYDEQRYAAWRDEQQELVRDAYLEEQSWEDRLHAYLVDGMELSDKEADEIIRLGEDRKNGKGKAGSEYTEEELEMLSQYSEAASGADDILDEEVEQSIAKEDDIYQTALDDFSDNFYINDDSGFFSDTGLRWMSDIANQYNLDWPVISATSYGEGGFSEYNAEMLADSLSKELGVKVEASGGYHSATRKPGVWIIEPDSSLEADDSDNMPAEIVSPPMPLDECLRQMENFFAWAENNGAYTNSSTGFHMGVSLPHRGGDVDFTKLALFLGDEHVLQDFGRSANTYCASAMKKIRQAIESGRAKPADAMELLKHNLLELAHRSVAKEGFGKYTSINPKGNYIEFRSAGGANYFEDLDKLKNTLLRYAQAMAIAGDPAAERKEYYKKLYKLISPKEGDPAIALFARYAAGELSAEELKSQWAEKTLEKERASAKNTGKWRVFRSDNNETLEIIDAPTRGAAADKAWDTYTGVIKFGVEPYDGRDEQEWEAYDPDTGKVLGTTKNFSMTNATNYFRDELKLNNFKVREKEPEAVSPRAKLAKRIKDAPAEQEQVWQVVNKRTGEVYDAGVRGTKSGLGKVLRNFEKEQGIPQGDAVLRLAPNQPKTDAEELSDIHKELGIGGGSTKWEFFNRRTNRVLDTVNNADFNQAEAVRRDVVRRHNINDDEVGMRKVEQPAQSSNPNPT